MATLECSRTVAVQFNWNKDNEEEHYEIKPETRWGISSVGPDPVGLVDL